MTDIQIGARRREEMGDLAGLADSIQRYGLIQPIVVDDQGRLVAGGRRLEACKRLGWDTIDVRAYGELSDQERAEIELEENIRRKDLTQLELSKELVRKAEQVAPALSATVADKKPRGHKRVYEVPKTDVAQAIGVGKATLRRAEQHVEAAETYPELAAADIPQRDALVMRRTLDELPEDVRAEKLAALRARRPGILAELAGLPPLPDQRPSEQVVRDQIANDPATHWHRAILDATRLVRGLVEHGDIEALIRRWPLPTKRRELQALRALRARLDTVITPLAAAVTAEEGDPHAANTATAAHA